MAFVEPLPDQPLELTRRIAGSLATSSVDSSMTALAARTASGECWAMIVASSRAGAEWVDDDFGGLAEPFSLDSVDGAPGQHQRLGLVGPDKASKRLGTGHVGRGAQVISTKASLASRATILMSAPTAMLSPPPRA